LVVILHFVMSSFLFFLCVIVTLSLVAQSLNEEEVSDWETDDVIEWLKNGRVSEMSVEYIVEEQKISDGAELLYLRDDPESRQRVHEGFPKNSDQRKFDRLLDELLSQIAAVESGDESVQSDNKAKEDANAYDVVDHADAADNDDDDDDDADDSIHDVSTSKKKKKKKAKKKSEQSSLSSDGQDIVFDAKLEIEAAHSNQSSLSLANSSEKVKTHAKSSKKSKRKSITKKPSKRKYNDTSKYDRKYEHRNNNDNDKDDDDTFDDDERKRNEERDDGAIDDGTTEIENERDVDANDAREQQSERERAISEHVFDESGNQVVAVVEPDSESKSKKYDAIERDEASSAKYGKYSKYNKYGKYDVVKDETELDDGVQEANENRLDDERFPAGQGGVVDIGTLLLQLKQYCALHEHDVCACLDAANKDDSHGDDLERQKALFMPHDDSGDDTNTDTDSGDKDDEDDDDGDSLVGAGENELHDDFNGDSKADSGEEDAETEMADDELKAPRLVDMERQTPNKSVSEAVDDVFVLPEAVEHVLAEKQELDTDTSTADDSGEDDDDDDDDDDDEETEDEDVDEWKLRAPANKQQIDDDDDDESGVRPVRSDKTLNVTYWTKDVVNNGQELKQEIVFNIGGKPKIDGILHLKWCLLELKERYCSEQTFLRGARQLHTTILTNVAYDFTIYDEQREYVWSLDAYSDNQPEQAFYFVGIKVNATLNRNALNDEKLSKASGANFDDLFEISIQQQIPELQRNRIDCDSPVNVHNDGDNKNMIQLICVLNIVQTSTDQNDKLMAEKIRSILFDVYKANTVEVSQKVDANSFASLESDSGWSSSTNSTLFFLCAMVLCGGAFIASQKKFAFKYQSVYSNLKKRSSLPLQHDAIDGEQERELNVDTAASQTSSSAEQFLQSVFKELGIPSFITSKNFHSLRDAYVTTVEQLRNFDDGDWKRHGFQAKHIEVIKNKLHDEQQHTSNDTDDNAVDDKDDSDIPDMSDNDGDKPTKGAKNDSTNADTDFDDFTDF